MKRSRLIRAIFTSLFILPLHAQTDRTIRRNTKKEPTPVLPMSLETNNMAYFAQPVTLTPAGIKKFMRYTYNHQNYGLEFLPNNFSHVSQFLQKGKDTHQKRAYFQSVFRLFSNKLKSSSYVNAYAFSSLLEELPTLIADHFQKAAPTKNTVALQLHVNEMLYSRFLSQFKLFKDSPVEFLDALSRDIITTIDQQEVAQPADPTSIEELRKVTLMFIDVCLNRLIWNPGDLDETWRSIKRVAEDLNKLFDHEIIVDQDDLNDLYRTLIERYCLFIDIIGEDLPVDFYDRVKQDIESQPLILLDLEEEEDVESKCERLMRSLTQAQQKALYKKKSIKK